ncbi:MAG: type I restriction endonuclease subunit R [Methylovulum miyakonense]|uniref:type I restriction endonuclease subunit R n=1 Tax=Methylovulum miyakonense TaxID=645578 RepID=UPI003BB792D9
MSYEYSEDGLIEAATQEVLEALGWTVLTAWQKESLSTQENRSDGLLGRLNKSEVLLERYLLPALRMLNPGLPETAYRQAVEVLKESAADKQLAAINKDKHELLVKGVPVSFQDDQGVLQKVRVRVFDFDHAPNNHFLAVRQFEVVGKLYNRRPDVVGFVNGIPLVFFELKAHHTDLRQGFDNNLCDYKDTIPELLHCNAFVILSNGTDSRVGTLTSPYKFFMDWKRIEEDDEGVVSLDTLLRGTCAPHRLMDLFENFLLFDGEGSEITKIMAKNHQFIGVNKVIDQSENIETLKGKLGVFWHTQGSGKSYSMVFLCQKMLRKLGGSYSFLLVVDRTELESQLYDTFSGVGAVTEENVRAKSRQHLRTLLADNHRYVFTLIHKFSIDPKNETDYPLITDRSNIIVISDEAHRTQGGTFASNMRFKGIPNASYLGFTGTPIFKDELELTRNIFGEYVSVYDFKRAITDGATLPVYYLPQGEKLGIENPKLDERMAEIINDSDLDDNQRRKLERAFKREYPILTSEKRLDAIAKDLVWHFNDRGYQGKAMFVTLDKPTAVRMYDLVMKYWPQYINELKQRIANAEDQQEELKLKRHLQRVTETEVCVVVSSEQNEVQKFAKLGLDIEPHRKKMVERNLETEFKDENNPFRLVFVCAMWITGFDVPCVSTVYLDKPIKGHTLVQTIARANRVYDDEKENGLIVDYGNVYQNLQEAYSVYGDGGKSKTGQGGGEEGDNTVEKLAGMVDALAVAILQVRQFLQDVQFDLDKLIHATTSMEKLSQLKQATNAVCLNETTRTQYEVAARDVFRKYKAMYPEPELKPFLAEFNAIEAIYDQLNQKTKTADISDVMGRLQQEVNISVTVSNEVRETDTVDISKLDFDKLRAAFAKSTQKNAVVFDLQAAIQQKLDKMVQQNPIRLAFYEKYQKIIEEYNKGKDIQAVQKAFDDLSDFIKNALNPETERAMREGLNEETLAIFDLLKKPELTKDEEAKVKEVAKQTLEALKVEKLKIDRWRESTQVTAQVKTLIDYNLQWLPPEPYPDEEVDIKSLLVYQHIYANYQGAGRSRYS